MTPVPERRLDSVYMYSTKMKYVIIQTRTDRGGGIGALRG